MACCGFQGTPFVQTLFMGASIVDFHASVAWNNSDGGLTVQVAEDKCSGTKVTYLGGSVGVHTGPDAFNPVSVGTPVTFYYGGFVMCGILQNWIQRDSATGPKSYNISIGPPDKIVNGVEVILSSYNGSTFGVPNLVNVHGFLEQYFGTPCSESGFTTYPPMGMASSLSYEPAPGWYKQSEIGWRWSAIKMALNAIINGGGGSYGGQLRYRGHSYYIDLSDIPTLNDEVHIAAENKTLHEIIDEVCKIAGVEYFYELVNEQTIKVRIGNSPWQASDYSAALVDSIRSDDIDARLNLGSISRTIASSNCTSKYERGLELRTTVTNTFITGEYRQDVWQIDNDDEYTDDANIWPYWGEDPVTGSVIMGDGRSSVETMDPEQCHHFDVDVTCVGVQGITTWKVNTAELRCALIGASSWRNYLATFEPSKFGQFFGLEENSLQNLNADFLTGLGLVADEINVGEAQKLKPGDIAAVYKSAIDKKLSDLDQLDAIEQGWTNCDKMYEFIRRYATEYYGRQFLVTLPFITESLDEDEPWSIAPNWRECDSGWADGSVLGINPSDSRKGWILEQFRQDDGKLKGFVKFTSDFPLILDGLNKNDFFIYTPEEVYVECRVVKIVKIDAYGEPNDWRAVIALNGPVRCMPSDNVAEEWRLLAAMLEKAGVELADADGKKQGTINKLLALPGGDNCYLGASFDFALPAAAAIPLQSRRLVYGPWFANRGNIFCGFDNGTTEYHREPGFAPWAFGSTSLMNTAGLMTALAQLGDKYVLERGMLTIPGAPTGRLGAKLDAGGPAVSSISVSVGVEGGVETTIQFKTWTPSFGGMAIKRVESIKRAARIAQKAERMFRKYALDRIKDRMLQAYSNCYIPIKSKATRGQSSHTMIGGASWPDWANSDHIRTAVGTQETTDTFLQSYNWLESAQVESIGVFRPFSTLHDKVIGRDAGYLPKYGKGEPKQGADNYVTNDTGDAGTDDSFDTKNTYFYSHEQVPPIFCYESHHPITVNTLSPFLSSETSLKAKTTGWEPGDIDLAGTSKGHDIEYIARDGVYPTHLSIRHPNDNYSEDHWYRAIALRGPLIIAGWGFDTDNKPVPNSCDKEWDEWTANEGPTMYFEDDWLRKPHKWKCGPVDLRWDHRRKVWTAPTPHKIVKLVLEDTLCPGKCAPAILYDDMMQWDHDGQAIKSESGCSEGKGYKVTVWSNSMRPVLKGWKILAYYDTTKARYELLRADEFPIVYAELIEDLPCGCNQKAKAIIIGVPCGKDGQNCGTMNPCGDLVGKELEVTNCLNQPLCAGRRFYSWVCHAEDTEDSSPKNPSIGNCEQQCKKLKKFKGIILQAEFRAQCVVVAVDLFESEAYSTDHFYCGPSGGSGVTGSFTPAGSILGTITIPTLSGWNTSVTTASGYIDETINGTSFTVQTQLDATDIDVEVSLSGLSGTAIINVAPGTTFTANDVIIPELAVTGKCRVSGNVQIDVKVVFATGGSGALYVNIPTLSGGSNTGLSDNFLITGTNNSSVGFTGIGPSTGVVLSGDVVITANTIDITGNIPSQGIAIDCYADLEHTHTVSVTGGTFFIDMSGRTGNNITLTGIASGNVNLTGEIFDAHTISTGIDISGTIDGGGGSGTATIDFSGVTASGKVHPIDVANRLKVEGSVHLSGGHVHTVPSSMTTINSTTGTHNLTFSGYKCTYRMNVKFTHSDTVFTYSPCVCIRQIFLESEPGITLCSQPVANSEGVITGGGTPSTCPTGCYNANICHPPTIITQGVRSCGYAYSNPTGWMSVNIYGTECEFDVTCGYVPGQG